MGRGLSIAEIIDGRPAATVRAARSAAAARATKPSMRVPGARGGTHRRAALHEAMLAAVAAVGRIAPRAYLGRGARPLPDGELTTHKRRWSYAIGRGGRRCATREGEASAMGTVARPAVVAPRASRRTASRETRLFIHPPFRFRVADALTNSSAAPLAAVSGAAFAGRADSRGPSRGGARAIPLLFNGDATFLLRGATDVQFRPSRAGRAPEALVTPPGGFTPSCRWARRGAVSARRRPEAVGAHIILGNTYHLYLRRRRRVRQAGGLATFAAGTRHAHRLGRLPGREPLELTRSTTTASRSIAPRRLRASLHARVRREGAGPRATS